MFDYIAKLKIPHQKDFGSKRFRTFGMFVWTSPVESAKI